MQVRNEAISAGSAPAKESIWQFFVNKCANNLHVVMAMSPVGELLRTRCRNFPGLHVFWHYTRVKKKLEFSSTCFTICEYEYNKLIKYSTSTTNDNCTYINSWKNIILYFDSILKWNKYNMQAIYIHSIFVFYVWIWMLKCNQPLCSCMSIFTNNGIGI